MATLGCQLCVALALVLMRGSGSCANNSTTTTEPLTTTTTSSTSMPTVTSSSSTSMAIVTSSSSTSMTSVTSSSSTAMPTVTSSSSTAMPTVTSSSSTAMPTVTSSSSTTMASVTSSTASASFCCQKMDCAGENCYQNSTFQQSIETCTGQNPKCWLVRSVEGSTVNYTSGCLQLNFSAPWCNASSTQGKCIMECCNTSLCLTFAPQPTAAVATTGSNASVSFFCQKMDCAGEKCYQNRLLPQPNETCTSQLPMCWFVRSVDGAAVSYTSGCLPRNFSAAPCNASSTPPKCIVESCATSLCLTYPPPPTTAVATVGSNTSAGFFCQKMDCAGENCYQNRTFQHSNETCTGQNPMCRFVRLVDGSAVNYTSGCVPQNVSATWCNASNTQPKCLVETCNTSLCLTFPPPPTAAVATTTTVATTTSEPMSDRVCQTFSCTGADCFGKVTPSPQRCYTSQLYCELVSHMDHSQMSFTAGCSSRCKGKVASCASQPECFQECCSGADNCLKLDGKLYDVNRAPRAEAVGIPLTLLLAAVAAVSRPLL